MTSDRTSRPPRPGPLNPALLQRARALSTEVDVVADPAAALRSAGARLAVLVAAVHGVILLALGGLALRGSAVGLTDPVRAGTFLVLATVALVVFRRSTLSPSAAALGVGVFQLALLVHAAWQDATMFALTGGAGLPGGWTALSVLVFAWMVPVRPWAHRVLALMASLLGPAFVMGQLAAIEAGPAAVISGALSVGFATWVAAVLAVLRAGGSAEEEAGAMQASDRQVGPYELVERLGKGGMGEVWRARHGLLTRDVAIKLIRRDRMVELMNSGDGLEAVEQLHRRFEREARLTAELSSPHTIRIFDFGRSPDASFYYVMELLDGLDVHTLVRKFGPQPEERVRYIMLQATDSLGEAHARGMVHRDVKPANVFVCAAGMSFDHVKLLDFGLVLRAGTVGPRTENAEGERNRETRLTTAGIVQGTPAYMAPEQVEGQLELDGRADLYALGCVAYFLLTGTDVYRHASPVRQMMAHLQDPVVDPNERLGRQAVSPQFVKLIMRLLEKDRDERFRDTEELATALHGLRLPRLWGQPEARRWYLEHLSRRRDGTPLPGTGRAPERGTLRPVDTPRTAMTGARQLASGPEDVSDADPDPARPQTLRQ